LLFCFDWDGVVTAPSKWLRLMKFIGRNTIKRLSPRLYYHLIMPFNHWCQPNRAAVALMLMLNQKYPGEVAIVTAREKRDELKTLGWWRRHFPNDTPPDIYAVNDDKILFIATLNPLIHFDNREDVKKALEKYNILCLLIGGGTS